MNILVCIFVLSLIMIVLLLSFDKSENYKTKVKVGLDDLDGCEQSCCDGGVPNSGIYCAPFQAWLSPDPNWCTQCLTGKDNDPSITNGNLKCVDTIKDLPPFINSDGSSNFCNVYKKVLAECPNDKATMLAWNNALLASGSSYISNDFNDHFVYDSNYCGYSDDYLKSLVQCGSPIGTNSEFCSSCPTSCNSCSDGYNTGICSPPNS
jgi:hypothetical protein